MKNSLYVNCNLFSETINSTLFSSYSKLYLSYPFYSLLPWCFFFFLSFCLFQFLNSLALVITIGIKPSDPRMEAFGTQQLWDLSSSLFLYSLPLLLFYLCSFLLPITDSFFFLSPVQFFLLIVLIFSPIPSM